MLCLCGFPLILQALEVKSNISRFSGFVWRGNEVKDASSLLHAFDMF